jgi:hypothetical protein
MSMSKLINVSNVQQLIDLNQDLVNFKLDFKVSSENNTPFNAVVASQAKLDSGETLAFKNVDNGSIAGNIIADTGDKQNYYLVLKSETPTKCKLEINLEEIPINQKILERKEEEKVKEFQQHQQYLHNLKKMESKHTSFFNTKNLIIFSLIFGGILFYYLFYVKKNLSIPNEVVSSQLADIPMITTIPDVVINSTTKPLDLGDNSVVKSSSILPSKNQQLLSKLNDIKFY